MNTQTVNQLVHRFGVGLIAAASIALAAGCALEEGEYFDEDGLFESDEKLVDDGEDVQKSSYYEPVGNHDVATCSTLEGWAKDGDTTVPIQVHIYRGAPYPSGTHVMNLIADKYRGDLPFADKNHGFKVNTPAAFKTGNWERVYIHAINYDTAGNPLPPGAGNNPLLNSTGKWLCCGTGCGQPNPPCIGGCGPESR